MMCLQKGMSRVEEYMSDPYTDAHVEYTMDGLYKGDKRRPFITYKNKTRSAVQDKSMPVLVPLATTSNNAASSATL